MVDLISSLNMCYRSYCCERQSGRRMGNIDMTVEQAIEQSIRTTSIVTLGSASEPVADAESVMGELFAECEDCAGDDPRSVMAEYWGTDDSGNEWRVHVWFR
jgi:hypothetical protein